MSGIAQIPGIHPLYAANHWPIAIELHSANFPDIDHACVDLHHERASYFPKVDILWASPECTKWSQGNSMPLPDIEEGLFVDPNADAAATQSRLLMFDVLRYAEHHRYRVMVIENVVDIATQAKYRQAWTEWRTQLTALGYRFRVVSLNAMHAQTYGPPAPQSRDRIYIVCWRNDHRAPDVDKILRPRAYCPRCDETVEAAQAWKTSKTGVEKVGRYRQSYIYVHGKCGTTVEPGWLPAADAIDWTLPGRRIGDRPVKDWYSKKGEYLGRGRLAPKTEARIAAGIARYWGPLHLEAAGNTYDAADPRHPQYGDPNAYHRIWPVDEELRALHTTPSKALAVPVEGRDGKVASTTDAPLRTMTTRNETALVLDNNHRNRTRPTSDPLPILTTATTKGLVEQPFIAELRGGSSDARPVTDPAATFCASGNHHALVTPAGGTWRDDAQPVDEPLPTVTTRDNNALVAPYYSSGSGETSKPASDPLGTLTAVDRYALIHRNNSGGAEMTTPVWEELRTLTAAGHQSLVQAGTRSGRPKVSPTDLAAAQELLVDCNFRMFEPHEVAAGMAFASTYIWQPGVRKKPLSKRSIVRAAGNSVCPPCSRDVMAVCVESFARAA